MSEAVRQVLKDWLRHRLPETQFAWLEGELAKLRSGQARDLEIAFGLTPRKLGRADLDLSAEELAAADEARPGWDPRDWTVDEAARILALLEFAAVSETFAETFKQLCRTAEVGEAVALYRGLPLYPEPEAFEWQVGEGLRTSMRAVFEAIAHRSPYPKENFSRGPLEPHGAEGALHRLDARADPGPRRARQPDARAKSCTTTRTSAGRRGGR